MKKNKTNAIGVAANSPLDALNASTLPIDEPSSDSYLKPGDGSIPGVSAARFNCRLLCSEGKVLHVRVADTWYSRLRGLLASSPLLSGEALVLKPCSAVHGFGLHYAIDVVFMDQRGVILRCAQLKPRSLITCWRAHAVVEMANGTIEQLGLKPGQQLILEERESAGTTALMADRVATADRCNGK